MRRTPAGCAPLKNGAPQNDKEKCTNNTLYDIIPYNKALGRWPREPPAHRPWIIVSILHNSCAQIAICSVGNIPAVLSHRHAAACASTANASSCSLRAHHVPALRRQARHDAGRRQTHAHTHRVYKQTGARVHGIIPSTVWCVCVCVCDGSGAISKQAAKLRAAFRKQRERVSVQTDERTNERTNAMTSPFYCNIFRTQYYSQYCGTVISWIINYHVHFVCAGA